MGLANCFVLVHTNMNEVSIIDEDDSSQDDSVASIEKNNEESSLFLYKTLEVQRYLNRFFGLYKMKIHNCKIFYSHGSLQVFVSFYITAKTIYAIRKNLTKYSKKLSTQVKRKLSKKKDGKYKKRRKPQFKLPSQKVRLKIKKIQKVKSKKKRATARSLGSRLAPMHSHSSMCGGDRAQLLVVMCGTLRGRVCVVHVCVCPH